MIKSFDKNSEFVVPVSERSCTTISISSMKMNIYDDFQIKGVAVINQLQSKGDNGKGRTPN